MNQDLQSLCPSSKSRTVGCSNVVCTRSNGVENSYKEWIDQEEEVESVQVGWKRDIVRGGCGDWNGDVDAAGRDRLALFEWGRESNSCKEEDENDELHDARHLVCLRCDGLYVVV
jgi:hypothetical protein